MNRSLSVVLPVRNAELTLADNLQHVFDVLADLTERFEVLLVDEGSTDHTAEVAYELALQYPQLRVTRRKSSSGRAAVTQSELDQTSGDVVFLHESQARFSPCVLRRLWDLSRDEESGTNVPPPRHIPSGAGVSAGPRGNIVPRPFTKRAGRVTKLAGVQMIHRAGQPAVR